MEQSPYWETNSLSVSQEIPQNTHNRNHNRKPLGPTPSYTIPIHNLTPYVFQYPF
jgi:hypothetical protein